MKAERVIIIDDDPVNNLLCSIAIRKVLHINDILTFTQARAGFDFLVHEYAEKKCEVQTLLLLDVNMPVMSGWEFMEEYNENAELKNACIDVFVMTSSVDIRDRERSTTIDNISGYIIKPITKEGIRTLAEL